jgi:hypothetical protein
MKNKSKENKYVAENNESTVTEEEILLEKLIGIKNFDTTKVFIY